MNNIPHFVIFILTTAFFYNYGICQLDLACSLKTPPAENHRFRDIAVNVSDKKLYISDFELILNPLYVTIFKGKIIQQEVL